ANNMSHQFRLLRDRTVDFLLGPIAPPFTQDDLGAEILYQDRLHILSGNKHPLARRRKIALSELIDQSWLLPPEGIVISHLAGAFEAGGYASPQIGVRTYSAYQRVSLLATHRFISAESNSVLHCNVNRSSLKVLPVDVTFPRWPIGIVTLKNRTVSLAVQNFLDYVREVARPLAQEK